MTTKARLISLTTVLKSTVSNAFFRIDDHVRVRTCERTRVKVVPLPVNAASSGCAALHPRVPGPQ